MRKAQIPRALSINFHTFKPIPVKGPMTLLVLKLFSVSKGLCEACIKNYSWTKIYILADECDKGNFVILDGILKCLNTHFLIVLLFQFLGKA